MKRHLRNLAFFLLGFFGAAVFMLARAETVAATATTTYLVDNSKIYGCTGWSTTAISPSAVCASNSSAHLGVYNGNASCLTSSNGFICSITATCSSGYSNSVNGGTNSVGATGGGGGGGDAGCDPTVQMCSSPETSGLYTKKEETFAGPLSRFTSGLKSSVLGQNATGFFTVSLPAGSCPNWTVSQSIMGASFSVDMRSIFCSETADKVMTIIGSVLMVVSAFGAFRWAFL